MADTPQPTGKGQTEFHHVKSAAFRVVYADGVIGGVSPRGNLLRMVFFCETRPLPDSVTYEHETTGAAIKMSKEISRAGKKGILRELEVDVMMPLTSAIEFREWLTKRIEEMEKAQQIARGVK